MKIFMSHSSRQKLFVKELQRQLPRSMQTWIDERELRVGSDIEAELASAIQGCDMFVLVVDRDSNESDWVRKEISWALDRENELQQVFLLPIAVEVDAWDDVDVRIRGRKRITVTDFTDESIAAAGRQLTSEVLEWLSNRLSVDQRLSPGALERQSNAELIRSADRLTSELATKIKARLLPYRAANPASLVTLASELRKNDGLDIGSDVELVEILDRLSGMHLLNGVEYDDEFAFLSRENYAYKVDLHQEVKKQMARLAARSIESGQTIALDGGSSVLQVARIVNRRLRAGGLQDLNVVTNSIPAANELLAELSSLGAGDHDRRSQIFLIGGLARPVSLTSIPYAFAERTPPADPPMTDLDAILEIVGRIDVAFLGANGTHGEDGLGTHNNFETTVKRWMVHHADERVVLMDPTKLDIPQRVPFASFTDGLRIITGQLPECAGKVEAFRAKLAGSPSTLEVVG